MPDVDGYMLMRQVRALAPDRGRQIRALAYPSRDAFGAQLLRRRLALTAYAGEFKEKQALSVGFEKHIAKPVEPEQLVQAIASLVGSDDSTQP
ncbi:multi-sensor hybrid histidine kinase [Kalymmatonema gypsitolerans NIES-4073]|nr:multi-sensor hybrid histidine kinase [Scytonema sp. NIES-4073]